MVNKVILVGNVGKDAEVRHLDSGVAVATFPLATSESYTNKQGERVTTTEWHNIVVWRGLAEFAGQYLTKGKQVYLDGRIRSRSYDDKDGNKKYITEIYADTINLLGRKDQENGSQQPAPTQPAKEMANSNATDLSNVSDEDDLPF